MFNPLVVMLCCIIAHLAVALFNVSFALKPSIIPHIIIVAIQILLSCVPG